MWEFFIGVIGVVLEFVFDFFMEAICSLLDRVILLLRSSKGGERVHEEKEAPVEINE